MEDYSVSTSQTNHVTDNNLIYINYGIQYSIKSKILQLIIHPGNIISIDSSSLCWCSSSENLYFCSRSSLFQKLFGSKSNDIGLCDVKNNMEIKPTATTATTATTASSSLKSKPIMCALSKLRGDSIYEIRLSTNTSNPSGSSSDGNSSNKNPSSGDVNQDHHTTHTNTVSEKLGGSPGAIRDGIFIHRDAFLCATGEFVNTIGTWKPWLLYRNPPTRETVEQYRLLERRQQNNIQHPDQGPDQAGNNPQNVLGNAIAYGNAYRMYDCYYFGENSVINSSLDSSLGSIFIQSEGAIIRKELIPGETMMIEKTCLIGHSSDCILSLKPLENSSGINSSSSRNAGLSGGGASGGFYYVTGPGFVYLCAQTVNGRFLKSQISNPGSSFGMGGVRNNLSPFSILLKMVLFSTLSMLFTLLMTILLHMILNDFSYESFQDAINELFE